MYYPRPIDPTPIEIKRMTAEIRSTWSELEHQKRANLCTNGKHPKRATGQLTPYVIQTVRYRPIGRSHARGVTEEPNA